MTSLGEYTACELLAAYRAKELSPVEVVETLLGRIDRLNPQLNAFYLVDHEGALAAARESEKRWLRGEPKGLLDGVPTSMKDALATAGMPTYRGSAANDAETRSWDSDAPCVARMREHGAISLGKTTMPDFGILASGLSSKHGVTRNPWNLDCNPGGSSAGAAVSIAAGLNPIAVGTDIVGSIRLPAAFCGLVGLKPSQGRVPYYFPNSPALVAGPMARTTEDAALLLNVITQPDKRDFTALPHERIDYLSSLDRPIEAARVGVMTRIGFGPEPDAEIVDLVLRAARMLEGFGCTVTAVESRLQGDALRVAEDFYRARCRAEFTQFSEERRREASVIERWSAQADGVDACGFYRLFGALQILRGQAIELMEGLDFLVLPTVPMSPYGAELPGLDADRIFDPWTNTFVFNLSEQPASSVPCGVTSTHLPVGLQIVGHRFDDLGVLRLTRRFEAARGDFPMPSQTIDCVAS